MNIDFDLDDLVMNSAQEDVHDATILIADKNLSNIAHLKSILTKGGYHNVTSTTDLFKVVPMFREHQFDLVLLDIGMSGKLGLEVLQNLQKIAHDDLLSVIAMTEGTDQKHVQQALANGAKDFITRPFEGWKLVLRVSNVLETRLFYSRQMLRGDLLENEILKRTTEIRETQFEIVQRLGAAGEMRDNETGAHVKRMSHICGLLASKQGLGAKYSELLLYASTMHDVGKIGVPDSILLKSDNLSEVEWQVMRQHPKIGARIIGNHNSKLINLAREIALYHHEKWDGSGYPHGIAGDRIPVSARIAAVSDVFDALTSERPYKSAWSVEKAIAVMQESSGSHFEPKTLEILIDNLDEVTEIKEKFRDEQSHMLDM